jgi:hypothetical protein
MAPPLERQATCTLPRRIFRFQVAHRILPRKQLETDQTDNSAPRAVNGMEQGRFQIELPSDEDAPTASNDIENNITLDTWYSDDDPDNPQNWLFLKKMWNCPSISGLHNLGLHRIICLHCK